MNLVEIQNQNLIILSIQWLFFYYFFILKRISAKTVTIPSPYAAELVRMPIFYIWFPSGNFSKFWFLLFISFCMSFCSLLIVFDFILVWCTDRDCESVRTNRYETMTMQAQVILIFKESTERFGFCLNLLLFLIYSKK